MTRNLTRRRFCYVATGAISAAVGLRAIATDLAGSIEDNWSFASPPDCARVRTMDEQKAIKKRENMARRSRRIVRLGSSMHIATLASHVLQRQFENGCCVCKEPVSDSLSRPMASVLLTSVQATEQSNAADFNS
jgi:hypothetical protein